MCAETSINTDEVFANSAAYVGSWLETIKAEPKMVIGAAAAAQKAADLVLEPTREAQVDPIPDSEPAADPGPAAAPKVLGDAEPEAA